MKSIVKQVKKRGNIENLLPYQFKPGQSGNPNGRPKLKTLKEYAADMLACMDDEERQQYFKGIPKEVIWKMAEGNPATATDVTSLGEKVEGVILLPVKDGNSLATPTETTPSTDK